MSDDLAAMEGLTSEMLVLLGEEGIKTIEDLAGCATDDLVGWTERKQGEVIKHKGTLSGTGLSATDAEALIMSARVKAGWITADEVSEAEPEA